MLPMRVFGATGDIYDILSNTIYTSADSSALKSDLRNKRVKENELFIEKEDGKLYKYSDMKRAERQAILAVLTAKGVDVTDADALKEGIINYALEIQAEQEVQLGKLVGEESPTDAKPPTNQGETSNVLSSISVTAKLAENNSIIMLTLKDAVTDKGVEFKGKVTVDISSTLEGNINTTLEVDSDATIKMYYVPDTYTVTIKQNDTVIKTETLKIDSVPVTWKFDKSTSTAATTVTGTKSTGYKITYALDALEFYVIADVKVVRPASTDGLKLVVYYRDVDDVEQTIVETPLVGNYGELSLEQYPYLFTNYRIVDGTGEVLLDGPIDTSTYLAEGLCTTQVGYSPKEISRQAITLTPVVTDDRILDVSYDIYQNDDLVRTEVISANDTRDILLSEGHYDIIVTANAGQNFLEELSIDFVYPDIDGMQIVSAGYDSGNSQETVQLLFKYGEFRQPDEDFTVEIINGTSQESKKITAKDGSFTKLDVGDTLQGYVFNVLNDEGVTVATKTYHCTPTGLVKFSNDMYYIDRNEEETLVDFGFYLNMTPLKSFDIGLMNDYYDLELYLYNVDGDGQVIEPAFQTIKSSFESKLLVKLPVEYETKTVVLGIGVTEKENGVLTGKRMPIKPFAPTVLTDMENSIAEFDKEDAVVNIDTELPFETVVPSPTPNTNLDFVTDDETTTTSTATEDSSEGPTITFDGTVNFGEDYNSKSKDSDSNDAYILDSEVLLPSKDEDEDELIATFEIE